MTGAETNREEAALQREKMANEGLAAISTVIKETGAEVAVVGGIARDAIIHDGKVMMIRPNGTVKDFDAIGLGPDAQTIHEC